MSTYPPEEKRDLAEVVDRALRRCYRLSPRVGLLDSIEHSDDQEDPSFVRDIFALKGAQGGGGFKPVDRKHFVNTLNTVAPQLMATKNSTGLWPSLNYIFDEASFDDSNHASM